MWAGFSNSLERCVRRYHVKRRITSADFQKAFTIRAQESEMQALNKADRVLPWQLGAVFCVLGWLIWRAW